MTSRGRITMRFRPAVACYGLATVVALSAVAEGPRSADDTGPRIAARSLIEHQRNGRKHVARAATSVDIGDVAVLVDNGSMVIQPRPANLVDLSNRSFTFEPLNRGFRVAAAGLPLDPAIGSPLALGDDSTMLVSLPFS